MRLMIPNKKRPYAKRLYIRYVNSAGYDVSIYNSWPRERVFSRIVESDRYYKDPQTSATNVMVAYGES